MSQPTRDELAVLLDGIDAAVLAVDTDWRFTYFNAAADELLRELGRSREALLGKDFWLEFPEFGASACVRELRRAVTERVRVAFDAPHPSLDRWLRLQATPTRHGLAVSLADVTARKRAERSRQELEDFFENASVSLHCVGPDGTVLRVNQAELDFLGYTREEYVGHHIAEFHADPAVIADILQRLARGETLRNVEARLRCKDGTIKPVMIDSSVLRGPNGEFLHTRCFTRDVTELKRSEDERARLLASERAARSEAETANRSKDEFLAILSHELRTPLTAVLGWTRMLRMAKLDAAAVQRALEAIERNTRTQSQLINDLLDVSRIITGKLEMDREPVHLLPAIKMAVESVAEAAERKQITLETALDASIGVVLGDDMRLCQIVTNLIGNAVKFTPEGGHVSVRLEERGDDVVVTVADDGVGIGPQDLPRVFDRFHQGHVARRTSVGGLGLGLAIVQHLVKQHGGRVTAHSDGPGRGARFSVFLPRVAGSRAVRLGGVETVPLHAIALQGVDVLVVEDDADGREIIRQILQTQGATVTMAGSGEEALEALAKSVPDLLISDIGLGGLDGFGLMRRIRELEGRARAIPAIALTAYARAEDRANAFAVGYQLHLTKPIEPAELQAAAANLVEKSRRGR